MNLGLGLGLSYFQIGVTDKFRVRVRVELLGASNSGSFFATQYNDNDNVFLQVCDGGKTLKSTKNRQAVK